MLFRTTTIAGFALILGLSTTTQAQTLDTTYAAGNGHHGNMFNIAVYKPLTVDSLSVHFDDTNNPAPACVGTSTCSVVEVEVQYRTGGGGYKPVKADSTMWTSLGTVQHTVTTDTGTGQPLALPIGLAMDPAGIVKYGMYVTSTGATNSVTGLPNELIHYTNGNGTIYENLDIQVKEGDGLGYPFGLPNGFFNPRTWNGTVHYSLSGAGCGTTTNYCTAGTSANGCQAILSSTGSASASAANGFTLDATGVEGVKDGLYFFGTNGQQGVSWGNGTSYRCTVPPTKRVVLMLGIGTIGACDGTFSEDLNTHWNTFPAKNPGSGAVVQAQLWYRDPFNTSNQTTSFSDAVEFTMCP